MIRSLNELEGYTLRALDGDIGRCSDFLFDDSQWTVRYMVADTGRWLPGRKILISPAFLETADWDSRRFPIRLTRSQIENGPPLDSDAPVSLRYERAYHDFFATTYYGMGSGLWGNYPGPGMLVPPGGQNPPAEVPEPHQEATQVRSVREVTGYRIAAEEGEGAGHVEDLLVDDTTWTLRYLVIDRSRLPFSRKVLLAVEWIEDVDWVDRTLRVGVTEAKIAEAPEYDPREPVNEAKETVLYDYYGRPRGRAVQRL
jgi:sporulation protein YlmC with PRC-barrel domain